MVERVLFRDRKHPVDRVIINDFNRKSGADLGEVTIVYGPAADEYTRSHHALALVLGTDIFFRNGDTAFNNSGETSTRSFILSISSFCLRFIKSSYNHISFTFKTCIINDSIIFCPYIHNILPLIFLSKVFMSRTFNGVINCGVPPLNHFIDVSLGLYHSATMASTPQGLVHQETVHQNSSFSLISSTNPKEILPPADSGTFSFIQILWMLNPCSFFLYNLH